MSEAMATAILEEVRLLRSELDTLRAGLEGKATLTTDQSASPARMQPYTVKEFATAIRRTPAYVSTRCRIRLIATLPGKPYLIPVGELTRYLSDYDTPTTPRKRGC